jgi:hypothetical protein
MKLYRGLQPEPVETCWKMPEEYIPGWIDGQNIWLKGTKAPEAQRETDLFLEIDQTDVVALFFAMLERFQRSGMKDAETAICAETLTRLARCLGSGSSLAPDRAASERPIEDLGLSLRNEDCLKLAGVTTVGKLAQMTGFELLRICGPKSFEQIKAGLASLGGS